MGFFADLFKGDKKKSESVVLIDIGADSVAGAYVHQTEDAVPILLHTNRIPIEIRDGESYERAMTRALLELGNNLIREGAPILSRATGSGRSDGIIVSIDTPLQETNMRTEDFERGDTFLFTKNIADTMLQRTRIIPGGKSLIDESIVSAVLNGYETRSPYEKNARKVSLTIFSSLIDKEVLEAIISTLRGLYLTENILPVAGKTLRYQTMHTVFPHEHDALILDAVGSAASIALIRKNVFIALANELPELTTHYPLPPVAFILADESKIDSLQQMINAVEYDQFWSSGNAPKIVPILPSHISRLVRQATLESPDVPLLLMALYNQEHPFNKKI